MRSKTLLMMIGLCIASSTVFSSPTTQEIQKITIQKGDAAPFGGILLSQTALVTVLARYDERIKTLEIEKQKLKMDSDADKNKALTLCGLKVKAVEETLEAQKKACIAKNEIYQNLLQNSPKAQWYNSPHLNFGLGCALCGGICAGAVAASRGAR